MNKKQNLNYKYITMKKITLTIGIPAHNEEANIGMLIQSIIEQSSLTYKLEKIIVICDGCTDNTGNVVKKMSKKYPLIELLEDRKRKGKMARLNKLYRMNQSEILITLDGDVVLKGKESLDNAVKLFRNDPGALCIAFHQVPIREKTFVAKVLYAAHRLWEEIRISVDNGNHIHNLQGAGTGLRKSFAKSVIYPKTLTTDQVYLAYLALKKDGFRYGHNSVIVYRPVATFSDFVLQGSRSVFLDQKTLADHFGNGVYELFKIPTKNKIFGLMRCLKNDPFYTILSIILQIYLRFFPAVEEGSLRGLWKMAVSTKMAILLMET